MFSLVDLNGGALQNGDTVHVQYASGKHSSTWRESAGKLSRSGDKPDKNCAFKIKWKQSDKTLMLQAPSGKWVSGPGKGKDLVVVAKSGDPTTVWELVKNPHIAPKTAKPAKR